MSRQCRETWQCRGFPVGSAACRFEREAALIRASSLIRALFAPACSAPSAGLEPAHTAPEADALSAELRGRANQVTRRPQLGAWRYSGSRIPLTVSGRPVSGRPVSELCAVGAAEPLRPNPVPPSPTRRDSARARRARAGARGGSLARCRILRVAAPRTGCPPRSPRRASRDPASCRDREEPGRPGAVLGERGQALDEALPHDPVGRPDLLALDHADRRHAAAAALGDLREHDAGRAQRLEHLGELGNPRVQGRLARSRVPGGMRSRRNSTSILVFVPEKCCPAWPCRFTGPHRRTGRRR